MNKIAHVTLAASLAFALGCTKDINKEEIHAAKPAVQTATESARVPSDESAPSPSAEDKGAAEKIGKVDIAVLATLIGTKSVTVLDANGQGTRASIGIVPGATLLTSYDNYDPATELPRSLAEKLVFYCSNEMCSASHKAAERAIIAGHTDVSVMPAGIMGWKDAGQKVEAVN